MNVIAIANRKGGTGKTTVATHLAGALATRGQNVLLIDTDPQGHAALCLGLRKEPGLYNLLVDNAAWQDVVRPVSADSIAPADAAPTGQLFVLPSDEKTQVIPMLDKNPFSLQSRIEEIDGLFDTLILDTAPTVTMFDGAVYLAAQAFLYVTECERLSLDGLNSGLKQFEEFSKRRTQPAHVIGIQPNMLREKTQNHAANLEALRKRFGALVWEPIAQRTTLSEATNFGKLVFAYAPSSEAAMAMERLARRFMEAIAETVDPLVK